MIGHLHRPEKHPSVCSLAGQDAILPAAVFVFGCCTLPHDPALLNKGEGLAVEIAKFAR
jgi:hypothetical protein